MSAVVKEGGSSESAGTVKQNLAPSVTLVSSQMRPPKYSMIFRHMARPIPVPGYVALSCRRWKIRKTRSAYCGSIPIPLSVTENTQNAPSRLAVMAMRGGCSPLNFSALLSRFWKTTLRSVACARTTGSGAASTTAPAWSIRSDRFAFAVASAASLDTGPSSCSNRPTRLNASRSLISTCIRVAPSTANSMYWSAFSSSLPA